MNRSQLKYYLKQLSKPVSLVALTIGFVGVIIGAAGLLLAVRYGNLLSELQRQNVATQQQQAEQAQQLSDEALLPIKYQVKPGDSSWNLAKLFYGNGNYYPVIERANNLESGSWLEVGTELTIPKLDQERVISKEGPSEKQADSVVSSSENYRLEVVSPQPAPGEKREKYVVQVGDSLWFISLKYLGSGYRWTELYALNRSVVGYNPDLIYPETVLLLPE